MAAGTISDTLADKNNLNKKISLISISQENLWCIKMYCEVYGFEAQKFRSLLSDTRENLVNKDHYIKMQIFIEQLQGKT